MGTGIALVNKAGKLQRKGIFITLTTVFTFILHGLAMDEIEHLQTDGVRIGVLIRQTDVFQRTVLHTDGLVHQHLPVRPVQRHDCPGVAFSRTHAGRDVLAGSYFLLPGDPQTEETLC